MWLHKKQLVSWAARLQVADVAGLGSRLAAGLRSAFHVRYPHWICSLTGAYSYGNSGSTREKLPVPIHVKVFLTYGYEYPIDWSNSHAETWDNEQGSMHYIYWEEPLWPRGGYRQGKELGQWLFLYVEYGANKVTSLIDLFWALNKIIHVKHLAQCRHIIST